MIAAAKVEPRPGVEMLSVSDPEPAPGEVLVQVAYCGICGSDVPVYRWSGYPAKWADTLPRVMGHEFSGTVVGLGSGVDAERFPEGAAVAVEPGVTCGHCRACRDGHPNLCQDRSIVGIDRDGAFAPLVTVPTTNVFRLPAGADLRYGAFLEVLAIAVHAVERARLTPDARVLVVGAGPIALAAAGLARMAGCGEVVVAGIERDRSLRFPLARSMGATQTMLAADLPRDGSFDVVFEASGAASAVQAAIGSARIGGRVVAIGAIPGVVEIDWEALVLRAITVTPIRARLTRHWTAAVSIVGRMPLPDGFFAVYPLSGIDDAFGAILDGSAAKVLVAPEAVS